MSQCSAVCGGLLGGAEDDEVDRLMRYGGFFGVLYLVVDDIIEEKMKGGDDGDDVGKKKGFSYVKMYGLEKSMEVAEQLMAKAKLELDGFEKYGDGVVPLYGFVDYAIDRGFSVNDRIKA